jgi:outer membrane immunogenic protein
MAVAAHFKPRATLDTFDFTIRRPDGEKSVRGIGVSFGCALGGAAAILFLLAAPASTGAASADPLPSAPLDAQWGGFYAGGELGGAWSTFDWTYTNPNFFNTLGATLLGSDFSQSASGVIGGAFAGYNYQTGPWVLGVELSAAGSSLERQQPSPFFPAIDTYTSKIIWLATATGRVGYAWDRWLVFAKGGWAGADVELTLDDNLLGVSADSKTWANGWTLGAGAEYMLREGISLGVVYDYVDLSIDGKSITCPACGTGVGFGTPIVNGDIRVQSVMARLSFRLGR